MDAFHVLLIAEMVLTRTKHLTYPVLPYIHFNYTRYVCDKNKMFNFHRYSYSLVSQLAKIGRYYL